jgi:GxxExxY protein
MKTEDLLLKEEVFRVVGAAMEVLNIVGHGLHEKPYENALIVEFALLGIPCEQQKRFPVIYKSVQISEYVPDMIVFGQVVVDAKVIDQITDHERGQMLNYLRISRLKLACSSILDAPSSNGNESFSPIIRVDSRPFAVTSQPLPFPT